MEEERCPSCHSEISPIPKWTNDPILTLKGLGKGSLIYNTETKEYELQLDSEHKGILHPNIKHIRELQDERKQQEIDMGIPETGSGLTEEELRTEFSEITPLSLYINKKHIRELRESTEKILDLKGLVLEDYFNYDEYGDYIGTYMYGQKVSDKIEWTDIDRLNRPNLPPDSEGKTKIKASHIEELRCPIPELYYGFGILSADWKLYSSGWGALTSLLSTYNSNNKENDDEYGYLTESLGYENNPILHDYYCGDNTYFWCEREMRMNWPTPYRYYIYGLPWKTSDSSVRWYKTNYWNGQYYYLKPDFVFSDNKYLWVMGYLQGIGRHLYKIKIKDFTEEILYEVPGRIHPYQYYNAMDLEYFYGEYYERVTEEGKFLELQRINKSDFSTEQVAYINKNYWEELGTYFQGNRYIHPDDLDSYTQYPRKGVDYYTYVGSDEEYIYYKMITEVTTYHLVLNTRYYYPNYYYYTVYNNHRDIYLVKFDKQSFGKSVVLTLGSTNTPQEDFSQDWEIAIGKNLIHILYLKEIPLRAPTWTSDVTGNVSIYKKEDMSLLKEYINEVGDFRFDRYNDLTSWSIYVGTSDEAYASSKLPKYLQE